MDFLVPKLSATMKSATVLRWLKQAGDKVRMGEPLVELETDKAAIEVEAPADGTLEAILAPEGAQLPIGATLGRRSGGGTATASAAPTNSSPPRRAAAHAEAHRRRAGSPVTPAAASATARIPRFAARAPSRRGIPHRIGWTNRLRVPVGASASATCWPPLGGQAAV